MWLKYFSKIYLYPHIKHLFLFNIMFSILPLCCSVGLYFRKYNDEKQNISWQDEETHSYFTVTKNMWQVFLFSHIIYRAESPPHRSKQVEDHACFITTPSSSVCQSASPGNRGQRSAASGAVAKTEEKHRRSTIELGMLTEYRFWLKNCCAFVDGLLLFALFLRIWYKRCDLNKADRRPWTT